jgi:CHAT domain-containing protein
VVDEASSAIVFIDGTLSTLEVSERAALYGSKLIYLSSCESAARRLSLADDTFSLAVAFIVAGAPSVVGTFWKVEDDLCPVMAEEFYRRWVGDSSSRLLKNGIASC